MLNLPKLFTRFFKRSKSASQTNGIMAQHGHSEACCTVPPAKAEYSEKGSFIEVEGMKTYKTGSEDATTAILYIFDIFGFSPQVLQGADFLAGSDYQVYIPDFFHGEPYSAADFPPDTPEKGAKLGTFFQGAGAPPKTVAAIPSVIKDIEAKAGGKIKKWGIVGMCWGGKVVSYSCGADSKFSAAAEAHPAMVDPNDAPNIAVPMCVLASADEDAEAVKAFEKALKVPSQVHTFGDQVHGFMAARGDLKDEKVRAEYERGYQTLVDFFHKYL